MKKNITTKEILSLAGIAIVTPLFALAILVSSHSMVAGSDVSLLLMALCGAVISGLTGFGRRTAKVDTRPPHHSTRSVASHS
jgi:hypothetical protein